jgi:hypothetical protein
MNLHHMVVDDFFEEPDELRNWALEKGFCEEISPVDGMLYKGVCKDPPWIFRQEAEVRLSYLMRSPAAIKLAFLRLTMNRQVEDDKRVVHLDAAYAKYAATVYLNPSHPIEAGTVIYRHRESGMEATPRTADEVKAWERDCNHLELWEPIGISSMEWNRALVMSTALFHASMPTNGFGDCPSAGRMVFVAFFDI